MPAGGASSTMRPDLNLLDERHSAINGVVIGRRASLLRFGFGGENAIGAGSPQNRSGSERLHRVSSRRAVREAPVNLLASRPLRRSDSRQVKGSRDPTT